MIRAHERFEYVHNKTDNLYIAMDKIGIKIFRWWLYFIVYKSDKSSITFIRTEKGFNRSFSRVLL